MEIKRCRKNSFRRALRRGHDPSKVSTAIGWLRLFSVSRSTCKKAYDAAGERVATKGATQVCVLFSLFSLVLTRAHFTQFHKVV